MNEITESELYTFGLYCHTGSMKDAALALNVRHQTVKNTVSKLYRKLGVNTCMEAAAKLKWLDVPREYRE